MVPLYTLNTAMSVSAGLLYYKTYNGFDDSTLLCFVLGVLMSIVGIFILASRKRNLRVRLSDGEQTRELSQRLSTGSRSSD